MKTLIFSVSLILLSLSAQAERSTQKLVCQASGKVRGIKSLVVESTDVEGQICAISNDAQGRLSFFVSNGSVTDAKIYVSRQKAGWRDGDDVVYLERFMGREGPEFFALQEYFACEPGSEYCTTDKEMEWTRSAADSTLKCKLVQE